jgi:hypothetical protein
MSITQTVEITASRRLTIDVPPEVPLGVVDLIYRPTIVQKADKAKEKHGTPIDRLDDRLAKAAALDRLTGCLAGVGDIDLDEIREERLAKYLK